MYRYAATDPRLDRGRYFYSPFEGPAFLDAYRESRRAAQARLAVVGPGRPIVRGTSPSPLPESGSGEIDTSVLLADALGRADVADALPWIAILTRKFEVGRGLRSRYGVDLRPVDRTEVSLDAYARFAALLGRAAGSAPASAAAPDLGILSAQLKVGDIVCHALAVDAAALSPDAAAAAREALATELSLVETVISSRRTRPASGEAPTELDPGLGRGAAAIDPADAAGRLRTAAPLAGVTLLAADTARARAYLSLLVADGLLPERAIVVEVRDAGTAVPAPVAAPPAATPLFDNVTPLADALDRAAVPATRLVVERFEDAAVLRALDRDAGDLVVVAGPPGVILASAFFGPIGRHYLHVHPGRLPDFRGSTPMYYALLAEGRLTATALLLDAGIDTGSVVAERVFAPPADLTTMDQAFDPWMRAALLRDVLRARRAGRLPAGRPQATGAGRTYFVIHPVLRHVALLDPRSLPVDRCSDARRTTGPAARHRGRSLPRVGRRGAAAVRRSMG